MLDLKNLSKEDQISYISRLDIQKKMYEFATECHRNMSGERMRFDTFQHMIELYDDIALFKDVVIVGATQIGKTDMLIIYILAAAYCGLNVFYVLPHNKMRDKYVQEKILRPISTSPEYKKIKKESVANSVEQLQFGKGMIRFVSANVRSEMTSFSADIIVIDETDQIKGEGVENIELGLGRLDGSIHQFKRFVSNPSDSKGFISQWYEKSDKRVRKCPCTKCGKFNELDWFKSVIEEIENEDGVVVSCNLRDKEWEPGCGRDVLIKCPEEGCDGNIDRFASNAFYEATAESEQGIVGYKMPSLISPLAKVSSLWFEYRDAIGKPSKMSAFYARRLAEAFSDVGHKISQNVLENCIEEDYFFTLEQNCGYHTWSLVDTPDVKCAMGIDVSPSHLDVSIAAVEGNKQRLVYIGKLDPQGDYELYDLIERYNVECAVIDIGPEKMFSNNFQETAMCDVWKCKYQGSGSDRDMKYNFNDLILNTDRTEALDKSYSKYKLKKIILPENYRDILDGTFEAEMKALSRVINEDRSGKLIVSWEGSNNDHSRHSDCYRNLAAASMLEDTLDLDSIHIG